MPQQTLTDQERIAEYGAIKPTTRGHELANAFLRWLNVATKATLGDIPGVRKVLPESVQKTTPITPAEKRVSPLLSLARDIALWETGTGIVSKAGKVSKLADVGEALIKATPRVGRFATKVVSEAAKGAIWGAATADTEKPKEIGEKALKTAAFVGATVPAMEAISVGGRLIGEAAKKSKTIKGLAEWLGIRMRKTPVTELIRKRYGDIQSNLIDSEAYISKLEKTLTPEQNRILPYIIEKKIPKEIAQNLRPKELKELAFLAKNIRSYLQDAHKFLMETYGDNVGFIKNYVPHIWDIPKNKEKQVINWFITRNPHLKQRLIPTIEEGVKKFGLKPKYENITDLLRVYDQLRIKAAANMKFVKDLMNLQSKNGLKLVVRADKGPPDWPVIDHPAVRKAMMVGKTKEGAPILMKTQIRVHPDLYDDVRAILENYQPGQMTKALDAINTLMKQSVLNLSLFHHMALSETGVATGIGKDILRAWNPVKIIRAFKNGNYKEVLNRAEIAKDGVQHGLTVGAIADVEGARSLVNTLKQVEKELHEEALAKGVKGLIRKPLEFNNKFLWDYLHTTMKLDAYHKLATDMIKRFPEKDPEAIKKEVAQFVNDTFGGQPWEILSKSPQWRQFSRFLLLSPDWTLSTFRQALSPFGFGAASETGRAIRRELGKDFWRKAILYFGAAMNMLNYAYTKAYEGKGRFMWDNPPGKKTYLFIGKNPDGSERYVRWGKQFRELFEFISNPAEVAGRKISPLLRAAKAQVFPSEVWQRDIVESDFWSPKGLKARAKQLLKDITPYSISQQQRLTKYTPIAFVLPVSKGMTPYNARKLFKKAIVNHDRNLNREVAIAAYRNGLDAQALWKQAFTELKTDFTRGLSKEAKDLLDKLALMPKDQRKLYLEKLAFQGKLTPALYEQMQKIQARRLKIEQEGNKVLKELEKLQE